MATLRETSSNHCASVSCHTPSLDNIDFGVLAEHEINEGLCPVGAMAVEPGAAIRKHLAFADAFVPLQRWIDCFYLTVVVCYKEAGTYHSLICNTCCFFVFKLENNFSLICPVHTVFNNSHLL